MMGFTPQSCGPRGYEFTRAGSPTTGDQRARRDPLWVTEIGANGMPTGRIHSVRHPRVYMRRIKRHWQAVRP